MWYVYIIRSVGFPEQEYTGATADLKQRVKDHNSGKSAHTAKFAPWELKCYVARLTSNGLSNWKGTSSPIRVVRLPRNA